MSEDCIAGDWPGELRGERHQPLDPRLGFNGDLLPDAKRIVDWRACIPTGRIPAR